ncbi:hypothetical protein PCANC_15417 [Puccinia coronata f. sp. avenae]|uniref:Uncharacterized protein n=1 Tax=Puccinia coronata f. sp. avenae TaxID=200324 RepID=A0A2N5SWK4_9BASI|nr:hypothetical protein PCANC_15417 [Puccinia coronata f. sp. avenae]
MEVHQEKLVTTAQLIFNTYLAHDLPLCLIFCGQTDYRENEGATQTSGYTSNAAVAPAASEPLIAISLIGVGWYEPHGSDAQMPGNNGPPQLAHQAQAASSKKLSNTTPARWICRQSLTTRRAQQCTIRAAPI